MQSLRAALAAQGVNGCPNGLLGMQPLYKQSPLGRAAFGFTRLSEVIKALRWPSGFVFVNDHPSNDGEGWQNNLQGLATDGQSWFMSRRDYLEIMPLGVDMQDLDEDHFKEHSFKKEFALWTGNFSYACRGGGIDCARIPAPFGYNHIGALTIDRQSGFLYLPLQPKPNLVMALQITPTTLEDRGWVATIPLDGDQGAWCAFDPIARMLYSSDFYLSDDYPSGGSTVDVYAIGTNGDPNRGAPPPNGSMTMTHVGAVQLWDAEGVPADLRNIQGGVITDNRHLYLSKDTGPATGGIVGYDLVTGRRVHRRPVAYNYDPNSKLSQELEGLCILQDGSAPGFAGDLHIILWENGAGGVHENMWIKHYAVTDPADRAFL